MQRSILLIFCLFCLVTSVSGYQMYIDCPDQVTVGAPVKCAIDSNFPAGTMFNVVFYPSENTAIVVSHQTVTIQENQKTQYKFIETTGLPGGQYKIEIQFITADSGRLSSDSHITELVKLIDSSGEISITSPLTQSLNDALRIEGSIDKIGNNGVKIEVRGPDGVVFDNLISSKENIQSGAGAFTKQVTVFKAGDYDVLFTDAKGYIGTITFHVVAPSTPVITAVPTTISPIKTTTVPTIIITPVKTTQPPTFVPTVTITTAPTKSIQELLTEQNQKIDEQNRLIAEQNTKLESQNDLLTQFLSKIKNIFGWN